MTLINNIITSKYKEKLQFEVIDLIVKKINKIVQGQDIAQNGGSVQGSNSNFEIELKVGSSQSPLDELKLHGILSVI